MADDERLKRAQLAGFTARDKIGEFAHDVRHGAGVAAQTVSRNVGEWGSRQAQAVAPIGAFLSGAFGGASRRDDRDMRSALTETADKSALENAPADPASGNPRTFDLGGFMPGSEARPGEGSPASRLDGENPTTYYTGEGGDAGMNVLPKGVSPFTTKEQARDLREAPVRETRRNFQLRQEGNAHLASDATPEERYQGQRAELMRQLNSLDFGGNQSIGGLANTKMQYKNLSAQLKNLDAQETARRSGISDAAKQTNENEQARLDRESTERVEKMKAVAKGSGVKTQEALLGKLAKGGWSALTGPERQAFTADMRADIVNAMIKEGDRVTPETVDAQVEAIIGAMGLPSPEAEQARAQFTPNALRALEGAKQQGLPGVQMGDGSTWSLDDSGIPRKLQ